MTTPSTPPAATTVGTLLPPFTPPLPCQPLPLPPKSLCQWIEGGGITFPRGFLAGGSHVGIKAKRPDLAFIKSETPATGAAVFTTNTVQAAPVRWGKQWLASGLPLQGCIINSGNANACTGEQGWADVQAMAASVATEWSCSPDAIFVSSTGIIGVPLPMAVVQQGVAKNANTLAGSLEAGQAAAEAIRTTDTFRKEAALRISLPSGAEVRLGGMSKGSGMIHPNMATMLGFICTDATVSQSVLQSLLQEACLQGFNQISVDGDTSTNDTVLALANGASGASLIDAPTHGDYPAFREGFLALALQLARLIAKDGEGATKLLEAHVCEAADEAQARLLSKAIIRSSLVKSAFFGQSANWGRILSSMGATESAFLPERVSMQVASVAGRVSFFEKGRPCEFDASLAKAILAEAEINIEVQLQNGRAEARAWGCDLSYEYVSINADYMT